MAEQVSIKQELAKLKQNQLFLIMGILLFAVVIVWVAVSLFTSQQQTRITAEQTKMATPLQPSIDTSIIDELANKQFYSDAELTSFTIYKIIEGAEGQRLVVPIDTPEQEFLDTMEDTTAETENTEPTNLLDALNTSEESTESSQLDDSALSEPEEEVETEPIPETPIVEENPDAEI